EILFGEQFLPAVEVLRVLAISYIFHSSCGFTGLNLIIGDKSKTQMVGKVLSLILHAVLNMFLIPELGALGAAWAVLISVIFSNLYNLYWVNRYFSFHPFDKRYTGLLFLNLGIAFLSFVTLEALSLPGFVCILLMAGVHLPLLALLSLKMGLVERSSLLVFVDWVKQVRKSKS
ncbi:MAG: polysaccharide biosynthesis C-terminal domain-containing protein, partial [Gammaproteobacteria bacterium]|nr:polysaccharide biosynthesis C-terminal domain-containing protein [Gammaproteobacteria bacterium]